MIEPKTLIEHVDSLAPPVTLVEIRHAERAGRVRRVTLSAIAAIVVGLAAVAWLGRDDGVEQQPAAPSRPDVEVTTPSTTAPPDPGVAFGPIPRFVPLAPPLTQWDLISFRSGVDENQELIPMSRYATRNDAGDGYAATLRVWTALTANFTVTRFADSEEEFRLADGRTAWRSDLGGTNARVEIDRQRSLVVQGQGLNPDQVLAALLGVELIDNVPVVSTSALPAGMARLDGSSFGNRTTSTTWTRDGRTITLTQTNGPGAQMDWRRCCDLANRWSSDPGAVDVVTGSWTRQIDEDTMVSIGTSDISEADARDFFDSLAVPATERWLVELEAQLLGNLGDSRLLDPGPLSARGDALVAEVGTLVVVWGGRFAGVDRTDGAVYDIDTGSWLPMAPHPTPPADAAIAVIADRVVIFGGTIGGEPTTAAAIYEPATDRWSTIAPFPSDGRITAGLVRSDATLLVRASDGFGHLFATLDPAGTEWSAFPAPPAIALGVESAPFTVSASGRWLAYVGTTPFSEPDGGTRRVQILDLETSTWTAHDLPDSPTSGRLLLGEAWIGDELVVGWRPIRADFFPGIDDPPPTNLATLDPATAAWRSRQTTLEPSCLSPVLSTDGDDLLIRCQRTGTEFRLRSGSDTWELDNPDAEPRFVPRPDSLSTLTAESAGLFSYLGGDGVPNTFVRRNDPGDR
jgi:Kelch motif